MENENEKKSKDIFGTLKKETVTPHLFLKNRVLVDSEEVMSSRKKIYFWKLFSILSTACLAISLLYQIEKGTVNPVAINRPYVIHMNFTEEESAYVAAAEIELPQGVNFHSEKSPEIRDSRKLKLPVHVTSDGRTKLPFVVVSKGASHKKILVRLFDKENKVIKENFINVHFARKS